MNNPFQKFSYILPVLAIFTAVGLSLIQHWEPGGESWSYWSFARLLAETGEFIVPGRSPLYTVYLNLFLWMPYPASMIVENFVTNSIILVSLFTLFRKYITPFWATASAILWLPFLQTSEPAVQNLALACLCLAVSLRSSLSVRLRYTYSYTLLIAAMMFRNTFIIPLFLFLVWDIGKNIKEKNFKAFIPRWQLWPIVFMLILMFWFQTHQSHHRWNNANCASTQWFPGDNKKLFNVSFIAHYNLLYIQNKYGNFLDKDYYFTNQELFKGAQTTIEAVKANPKFVFKQMLNNVKSILILGVKTTLVPSILYNKFPKGNRWFYVIHPLITLPLVFIILYGAFRGCANNDMLIFILSNIFIIGTTVLVLPKMRYMTPMIPILILSAYWWANKFKYNFKRINPPFIFLLTFIFFSNGIVSWAKQTRDAIQDLRIGQIKILEDRSYSMKAAKKEILSLIQGCKVLSPEHGFLGIFTEIPFNNIYDIWEIPPFGNLNNSSYHGLDPNRINCVMVPYWLPTDPGSFTNARIRYDNYIKPYVKQLISLGASTHEITSYGHIYILKNDHGPKK